MKRLGCLLLLPLLCLPVSAVRAAALAFADQSAAAMGVANAFVAAASDVSALHYNPAGIAWQDGARIMAGGAVTFRDASANTAAGAIGNAGGLPTLWHAYGSWMPLERDWGLGISINAPYAMQNNWGTSLSGQAAFTDFVAYKTALDVVYAANSNMAFAIGADWYLARLDMDSATSTFRGTDKAAFGGHIAWRWKPRHALAIGALLRSGSRLKLSGNASGAVSGSAGVDVRLPSEVQVGVAYDIIDPLRLEVDGAWTRWSQWSNLDLVGGGMREANTLNLRDSYAIKTGLTWTWREGAELRFGYAFDQAANKDPGFHARIADANNHRISFGAGGDMFGVHADLAYAYTLFTDRSVTASAPFNGIFSESRHTFILSVGTAF